MNGNTFVFINEASSLTDGQVERFLLEMKLERMFPTRPKFQGLHWIHTKKAPNDLWDKLLKTKR